VRTLATETTPDIDASAAGFEHFVYRRLDQACGIVEVTQRHYVPVGTALRRINTPDAPLIANL
jgi:hypothetical protein